MKKKMLALHFLLFMSAAALTSLRQINTRTATLKLTKWINFTKRDVLNRKEAVNQLSDLYTIKGNLYRKWVKEPHEVYKGPVMPVPWTNYELGDEIFVMADETIPVPFSIDNLIMTTETFIGVCEICTGTEGEKVATLHQLVSNPNLNFLRNAFEGSPAKGYGVEFVKSATEAGLSVDLQPLVKWGDGRHFLHLNEDILLE